MAADDLKTLENPKWIRGYRNGRLVVDSRRTLFVWEHEYYPAWYVPVDDVDADVVVTSSTFDGDARGAGSMVDLHLGADVVRSAGWRHLDTAGLRDRVRLEWDAMDAWFEEDVEVFVHPRSPEVRVDVLPSSKHVRVLVDGVVVADSVRSSVLYEASLPPRYYVPQVDVRMDLLASTDTESQCPYKGWAHYWSVTVDGATHEDIAWGYRTPLPESVGVAGLVCFYNEQVDIEVDGELLSRPVTKFS
ncbi:MAG: DUF427 domain-containing protein [Ilumatobacter sp.]|uniref:DUF427 domain-containing protein n=1 Tax=Ilumatobacter sp. TaxID=1967498 RepID=UPI003C74799E